MADVKVYHDRHATLKIITKNPKTKEVVPITGAKLYFQVKTKRDINETPLIEKKNSAAGGDASEIEDSDLGNGEYKVHLTPSDLNIKGNYWCETKMTLSGEDSTIFQRRFIVIPTAID